MQSKRLVAALAAIMLLVLATVSVSASASPFIGVGELRPGLKGKALTVMRGTAITSFGVEVLGVTEGIGSVQSLVLVRVYGPALADSRGIAAGMSGSPVYIGNRLLGAISYTFVNADPHIGLVTPIHDMVKLWDYEQNTTAFRGGPVFIAGQMYGGIVFGDIPGSTVGSPGSPAPASGEMLQAVPVRTPLAISGLGPRARRLVSQAFEPYGLISATSAGADVPGTPAKPEPGSVLGVQLAFGDVSVAAIGTLTWLQGDRFVGFGHPFLNRGGVGLVATSGYVYRAVASPVVPQKLAAPHGQIGMIVQDRTAGVTGRLGSLPAVLPVEIQITDSSTGNKTRMNVSVVYERMVTPLLTASIALEALDRCLDRLGAGTARVVLTVETDGGQGNITRENLFHHRSDIAAGCIVELADYLNFLFENEFRYVAPSRVLFHAEVSPENLSASIIDIVPSVPKVSPGETIDILVTMRPFRGETQVVPIRVEIPRNIRPGRLDFFVRGAARRTEESADEEYKPSSTAGASNFGEAVGKWLERPRNNELVLQYVPVLIDQESSGRDMEDDEEEDPFVSNTPGRKLIAITVPTGYVVQGGKSVSIEVVDPSGKK